MDERNSNEPCENNLLERVVNTLRRGAVPNPILTDRIMGKVRAEGRPEVLGKEGTPARPLVWQRRVVAWSLTPLTLRVPPLAAAAVVCLVIAFGAGIGRSFGPSVEGVHHMVFDSSDTDREGRQVQFVLVAPEAERVTLVGSFNDWDPSATPLARDAGGGFWTVELRLARGRHLYAFVVDGKEWVLDRSAPVAPADEFGTPNSVLLVSS